MSHRQDPTNLLESVPIALAVAGVIASALIIRPRYGVARTTARCAACSYDVRGVPTDNSRGVCPECGSTFPMHSWPRDGVEVAFSRRVYIAALLIALTTLIPWIVTHTAAPLVGLFDPYYARGILISARRNAFDFDGIRIMIGGAISAMSVPMFLWPRVRLRSWLRRIAAALLAWCALYLITAWPNITLRGHIWDSPLSPNAALLIAISVGFCASVCPGLPRQIEHIRALIPFRNARARPSPAISQAPQDPTARRAGRVPDRLSRAG